MANALQDLSRGATLSNYTPSLRENITNKLAQLWYGDNREGTQKANRLMDLLDFTPVGMATGMYDAGRDLGQGNYGMGLAGIGLAAMPVPGAIKKEFHYAPKYRPPGHETVPPGFTAFGPPTAEHKFGTVVYDKPIPFKDEDAFELVPLDPNHHKNIAKRNEAFKQDFQDKFSDAGETYRSTKGANSILVTPSTTKGVQWQLTHFNNGVPTGHSEIDDFDELTDAVRTFEHSR